MLGDLKLVQHHCNVACRGLDATNDIVAAPLSRKNCQALSCLVRGPSFFETSSASHSERAEIAVVVADGPRSESRRDDVGYGCPRLQARRMSLYLARRNADFEREPSCAVCCKSSGGPDQQVWPQSVSSKGGRGTSPAPEHKAQ